MKQQLDFKFEQAKADLVNDLDNVIKPTKKLCIDNDSFQNIADGYMACEMAYMVGDLNETLAVARSLWSDVKRLIDELEEMQMED